MGILRLGYWSGVPFPSPGDLLDPGIEPRSPTLQADSLPSEPPGKPLWGAYQRQHWVWKCEGIGSQPSQGKGSSRQFLENVVSQNIVLEMLTPEVWSRAWNLYLTCTPGDSDAGHWQPGVQKHCYQVVSVEFLCNPCTLLLTPSAWYHLFFSSKRFSNVSFGRFSPSSGREFEVSFCCCRRTSKKSSLWCKCVTPRCSAGWFTDVS